MKYRNWTFTLFKNENYKWNTKFDEYKDLIRFLVVQQEMCPKTKKNHWQGYNSILQPNGYEKDKSSTK